MDKIETAAMLGMLRDTLESLATDQAKMEMLTKAVERWAAAEACWDGARWGSPQAGYFASGELHDAKEALRALVKP